MEFPSNNIHSNQVISGINILVFAKKKVDWALMCDVVQSNMNTIGHTVCSLVSRLPVAFSANIYQTSDVLQQ